MLTGRTIGRPYAL